MSITEKLNKIKSCKEDIKQAIIDKGVDMTGVSLEGYATKISEMQSGGGDYLDIRANMSTYYSTAEIVDNYAFAYCSSLQSIDLPNCSYVGNYAFLTCHSLQSVNLPMCLSVDGYTFSNCSSLQSVNLPNCSYVGGNVFNRCSSLQSIDLPNCSSVATYTFASCSSLQSVNLPMCLGVGNSAFYSCSSLTVLDLRSTYSCSLTNSKAFLGTPFASGVGSIYVHNTVLSQFQNATNWTYFSNCLVGVGDPTRPLLSFDNGRVYGDAFRLHFGWISYLGITSSSIISIDLPNYVSVGTEFSRYSSLQSVNLPNCSYVGKGAFFYCFSLQSVNLPNCSYVGASAFYSTPLQSVNLPNCSYVGEDAFQYCTSLQSIDLPNCSYVGKGAFYYCSPLQSIDLPNCSYVGYAAFGSCTSLQSVNLPNCSYVGASAFDLCFSLSTIYIGTSISTVCELTNATFTYRDRINIFVPMSLVDAYKSAQNWSYYASRIYGI